MITNETMTPAADAAGRRYSQLVNAWRAVFDNALNQSDFGTAVWHDRALREASDIAISYMRLEQETIEEILWDIAIEARVSAKARLGYQHEVALTDLASEHLSATQSYLATQLASQVARDVAQLGQGLRKVYLEVSLSARARNKPLRAALIEHRIGDTAGMRFFAHDRAGRGWDSHKFVRAIFRHALLGIWNENTLMELADAGRLVAAIEHPNPDYELAGTEVALAPGAELPSYAEIRGTVFHPNSDAFLVVPEL